MKLLTAILTAQLLSMPLAYSRTMGRESGGGDSFTLDFIHIAENEVLSWIEKNNDSLKIDLAAFKKAIDPKKILSKEKVYESCDDSNKGREVEICYNSETDLITISRTRYSPSDKTAAKRGLIAHEIFRKMGLEGDDYSLTKRMLIDSNAAIEIDYQNGLSLSVVAEKIGITQDFFNQLVLKKLTRIAYTEGCGLSLGTPEKLLSVSVSRQEDAATEEISYIYFDLELEHLTLSFSLIRIEGAGYDYDPVESYSHSCK